MRKVSSVFPCSYSLENNKQIIFSGAILKLDPAGAEVSVAVEGLDYPSGLAFAANGDLYFGNVIMKLAIRVDIHKLTPDGDEVVLEKAVDTSSDLSADRQLHRNQRRPDQRI